MINSEIDSELNELLLRLIEVITELREDVGDRETLLQERAELLARARKRGVCFRRIA